MANTDNKGGDEAIGSKHSAAGKRCAGCKEVMSVDNFYHDTHTKDRRNRYCKRCCKVNRTLETLKRRPSANKHWHHSLRAQKYNAPSSEGITLVKLYKRDRGTCGICGHWVMARDASVGHIVPLSAPETPGHVWSNVQLEHLRCNQMRGDYYVPA